MRNRRLLAAVAAATVLAFAGCGDDDETTTDTSAATALTEEDFVTQANEICSQGGQAIDQAANQLFGGQQPTQQQIEQFVNEILVPGVQSQIDGVRALTPPEAIADQVDTFLNDAQSALDELEADPSLVQAGDTPQDPFADVNVQAEELGLTECAD